MTTIKNPEPETVDVGLLAQMLRDRPEVPDGKSEDVEVTHQIIPAGSHIPVVSMRNALFMGQVPTSVVLEDPLTARLLTYKNGVWMNDQPQEVWQMREPLAEAYGNVLVGGLGLGVISHLLSLEPDVDQVTTVELDPNIIKLVQPHIDADCVYQNDLFEFVKTIEAGEYDYALFDVWQMTGQTVWANMVVPLRRWCFGVIKDIHCWNEKEMLGQCEMHLPVWADVDLEGGTSIYPAFNKVFREAVVAAGLRTRKPKITNKNRDPKEAIRMFEVGEENRNDPKIMAFLHLFLNEVGSELWESHFGKLWDEFVVNRKENE